MASVYSCIKGKFGPWDYYHITMPAADVATKLMIPKDMPGWEDLSLEEKFQRKLNKNRVRLIDHNLDQQPLIYNAGNNLRKLKSMKIDLFSKS